MPVREKRSNLDEKYNGDVHLLYVVMDVSVRAVKMRMLTKNNILVRVFIPYFPELEEKSLRSNAHREVDVAPIV